MENPNNHDAGHKPPESLGKRSRESTSPSPNGRVIKVVTHEADNAQLSELRDAIQQLREEMTSLRDQNKTYSAEIAALKTKLTNLENDADHDGIKRTIFDIETRDQARDKAISKMATGLTSVRATLDTLDKKAQNKENDAKSIRHLTSTLQGIQASVDTKNKATSQELLPTKAIHAIRIQRVQEEYPHRLL